MRNTRRGLACVLAVMMMIVTVSCGRSRTGNPVSDNPYQPAEAGHYDSEDTAVLMAMDTEQKTVTLLNLDLNQQYTLRYDAKTTVTDKHGTAMVWSQFRVGDLVRVRFRKGDKQLTSLMISPDSWYYDQVTKYTLTPEGMYLGEDAYRMNDALVVASGDSLITLDQLIAGDEVTIVGIDRTIYSILMDRGHGYVRVVNADAVDGGWIQIGTGIEAIRDGMLITVPEGEYTALVSYNGVNENYPITVERGQETELDLGEIEIAGPTVGTVTFTVLPDNARVYIDSVETDISHPVILTTGIHQIILAADGYQTTTQYLNVGAMAADVTLTMTKLDTSSKEDTDTNRKDDTEQKEDNTGNGDGADTSGNGTGSGEENSANTGGSASAGGDSGTAGQDYSVSITTPEDVEVYVDGIYMGIAPLSFRKPSGNYIITLRKTGCQTRNYSVNLEGSDHEQMFHFATLLPLEQ